MSDQPETFRLRDGDGAVITTPEWADRRPSPAEWLDWFMEQSREAQEQVVEYQLAAEQTVAELDLPVAVYRHD